MIKLDCFGDFCPVPLLKAKELVETIEAGESIQLVTDHSCVVESLQEYFNRHNYDLKIDEVINGVWEIEILKK